MIYIKTTSYICTLQLQPGTINAIRTERPKICQMDLAGLAKGSKTTKTSFHRYLPTRRRRKKIIMSVKKETNATLPEIFVSSGTLLLSPSNVSVTK